MRGTRLHPHSRHNGSAAGFRPATGECRDCQVNVGIVEGVNQLSSGEPEDKEQQDRNTDKTNQNGIRLKAGSEPKHWQVLRRFSGGCPNA
jgi:hypothetical protein